MPKRKGRSNYEGHAHFRVPAGFMDEVHAVAEGRGLSAAGFMRMAILEAMDRAHYPMKRVVYNEKTGQQEFVEVNLG